MQIVNCTFAFKYRLLTKLLISPLFQVLKLLGNGRLEAQCFDGVKRLCHIRGKLRKKVWINQGDIILIGLRDYQDSKADVIQKYNPDEARNLKAYKELPETAKINDAQIDDDNDLDGIEFQDDIDGESDDADEDRIMLDDIDDI